MSKEGKEFKIPTDWGIPYSGTEDFMDTNAVYHVFHGERDDRSIEGYDLAIKIKDGKTEYVHIKSGTPVEEEEDASGEDAPDFLKAADRYAIDLSGAVGFGASGSITGTRGGSITATTTGGGDYGYVSIPHVYAEPTAEPIYPYALKELRDDALLPHITRAVEEGLRKKIEMDTIIIDKGVAVSQGADHADMIMGLKVKYAEEGKLPCGSAFIIMKDKKPKAEDKKEGADDETEFVRIRTATGEHLIRKADIKTISVVREPGTIDLGGFKTAGPLKKIAHIFTISDRRPITTSDMESIDDVFRVLAHRHLSVDPEDLVPCAGEEDAPEDAPAATIDPDAGFDAFARSIKARDSMLKAKKLKEKLGEEKVLTPETLTPGEDTPPVASTEIRGRAY